MESLEEPASMSDDNEKMCCLCSELGQRVNVSMYCSQCEEMFCDSCSGKHLSQKFAKNHLVISIEQLQANKSAPGFVKAEPCEPCSNMNKECTASNICIECEEKLCDDCSDVHTSLKMTKTHHVIPLAEYQQKEAAIGGDINCEPCFSRDVVERAIMFCEDCEEDLCSDCEIRHRSQKFTRDHSIIDVTKKYKQAIPENDDKKCEPCAEIEEKRSAFEFCKQCKEYLCKQCASFHKLQKATKIHNLIKVDSLPKVVCDICQKVAIKTCIKCKEHLCQSCTRMHAAQKATKSHVLKDVVEIDFQDCDLCSEKGTFSMATKYCNECKEFYCKDCGQLHSRQRATKTHKLTDPTLEEIKEEIQQEFESFPTETHQEEKPKETVAPRGTENKQEKDDIFRPGRPFASDERSDSVTLTWEVPKGIEFGKGLYQIRFKEVDQTRWNFYTEHPERANVTISGLKSECSYVFQVRALIEDEEGPYGPQSDKVKTSSSMAAKLLPFTSTVKNGNPAIHKILSTEIKEARNEAAKTRKFELGRPPVKSCKEKTILLVGATGSGKSTLVDGIINYVAGVNWKDRFRFTLIDLENDEKNKSQALSQTEWITCYTINPEEGSRLDYKLNIIDTPGFGDTRGLDRDNQIVGQLRELFSSTGSQGVVFIDAVCFLAKAPDARLTATQKYIFMSILSLFGQDIEENICTLITFADGHKPPVLDAIKAAELPTTSWYVFNNSGLFAENDDEDRSSLAPMFWDMGNKSFKKFFASLDKLTTKSLQQTQEVLQQRQKLEVTISNLQPQVDAGLNKLSELRQEIEILKRHEKEILDNKDFEYEVEETKQVKTELPKGRHVTNCLNCNITCHDDCAFANDEDKRRCCVMDGNGYCTFCDDKCFWKMHHNNPYIFSYKTEKVKKTYSEKKKLYQKAGEEKVAHQQVVERMKEDLDDLTLTIEDMMEEVNECNTVLKSIALHPNPLSMVDHIDLMIESEKMEKKEGFQRRIQVLHGYRKRAEIHKDVVKLQKDLSSTVNLGPGRIREKKRGRFKQFISYLGFGN